MSGPPVLTPISYRSHRIQITHTEFKTSHRCDVLNSVRVIWIRCEDSISVWSFEFGVSDLNSVWAIWNRCERFEFGARVLEFGASVLEFGASVFEFGVNNLHLVWVFRIWCEWFQFSVSDSNSVYWALSSQQKSPVQIFGIFAGWMEDRFPEFEVTCPATSRNAGWNFVVWKWRTFWTFSRL